MNIDAEREIVSKVEDLIQSKNFGQICFEAGKFIETVASEIYFEMNGSNPKTAKAAIDFIVERKLISRPLGYKLHVVREMRNVEAHDLPYLITSADAKLAIETLNQTIEWLHQGNLAREWQEIYELFSEGESMIQHSASKIDNEIPFTLIFNIQRALERAIGLKIKSLGLEVKSTGFFSSVELLAKHGIDVKSTAWRDFVGLRNRFAHSDAFDSPSPEEVYRLLKSSLPELREILIKLNPLDNRIKDASECPQINSTL
ncbi:MAG: HepT-like ribonuclease domain-containing protein [Candidatus Methylomirabilales bacterium]